MVNLVCVSFFVVVFRGGKGDIFGMGIWQPGAFWAKPILPNGWEMDGDWSFR